LWSSLALLCELEEVLARAKFRRRIEAMATSSEALFNHYVSLVEVVAVEQSVHVVSADPDDDIAVSCALAAEADCLVASDGHLLALGSHSGIPIVNPSQFLMEMVTSASFADC
jgi:putative PIN family toxin of toxin-antitoxin system